MKEKGKTLFILGDVKTGESWVVAGNTNNIERNVL